MSKNKSAKKLLEIAWKQYLEENDDFYYAIEAVAMDFNQLEDINGDIDSKLVPIAEINEQIASLSDVVSKYK